MTVNLHLVISVYSNPILFFSGLATDFPLVVYLSVLSAEPNKHLLLIQVPKSLSVRANKYFLEISDVWKNNG